MSLYDEFFFDLEFGKHPKSQHTIAAYRSDLAIFANVVQTPPNQITNTDIRHYVRYLKATYPDSLPTRNRKIIALRRFLKYLQDTQHCCLDVWLPTTEKQARLNILSETLTAREFSRLIYYAEQLEDLRAQALMFALRYTGGRISEVLQVDTRVLKDRTFTVVGKGNKERKLFFSKALQKILKEYVTQRKQQSLWLFPGYKGRAMCRQHAYRIVQDYAGKARIALSKVHPHAFRHLFCIEMAEKLGIELTADLAGHTDINITRGYTHRTERELLGVLDEAITAQHRDYRAVKRDLKTQAKDRKRQTQRKRKTQHKK